MHARPELREHLLATKMRKWAMIGRHPNAFPNCSASRARRNYARLYARNETLARSLNLDPLSAYPPL